MEDQVTTNPEDTSTSFTPQMSSAPEAAPVGASAQNSESPMPTNFGQNTAQPVLSAPKKSKKKLLLIIVLLIVLLVGAAALYFFVFKKKTTTKTSTQTTSTSEKTNPVDKTNQEAKSAADVVTESGSTYYAAAKKLDDLKLVKDLQAFAEDCTGPTGTDCKPKYAESDFEYYDVGTTKDGKHIIVMYTKAKDIDGGVQYILLQSAEKKYQLLALHDSVLKQSLESKTGYCPNCSADLQKSLIADVIVDKKTTLPELIFPNEATVNGQKLKLPESAMAYFTYDGLNGIRGSYDGQINSGMTNEKLGTFGSYTLYRTTTKATSTYKLVELHATLQTSFGIVYKQNGELASSSDTAITPNWSTGDKNTSKYFSGGQGCGTPNGYVIGANVDKNTLVQIGTTKGGQKLYQVPQSDALFGELYDIDYANSNDPNGYIDKTLQKLSKQQFSDKHAYFLIENGLGEYVIYQRDDMFVRGGCGKPVVYLYPTQTTDVSVQVDADVVVSEPAYGQNGWQHVLAQPNGTLTFGGKTYSSLYWEGYGKGAYPAITTGTVVARSQVVSTIKEQLAEQGFTNNETTDFLAYWGPKLPSTPYIRLTWLGTAAMNRLAPLHISPAPQTVIRTFLDFEGLQTPQLLPPQHLTSTARTGFTLVEWGGLLKTGISAH
jgi:hypothetical protein